MAKIIVTPMYYTSNPALLAVALVLAVICSPALSQEFAAARRVASKDAEKHVPQTLKDPKSAKFDPESVVVESVPDGTLGISGKQFLRVRGIVRGRNSFGATVPSNWMAIVRNEGETLATELLLLEDEVVYATEEGNDILSHIERDRVKADMQRLANQAKALNDLESRDKLDTAKKHGAAQGELAARALRRVLPRMSEKEITSRAKRAAKNIDAPDDQIEAFVAAYVNAMKAAKTPAAAK